MPVERFASYARAILSGTLAPSTADTVDTVNLVPTGVGALFPAGDFNISIDSESMLVTARAGDVLTVLRGQYGSAAVAHESGTYVLHGVLGHDAEGWEAATAESWLRWAL